MNGDAVLCLHAGSIPILADLTTKRVLLSIYINTPLEYLHSIFSKRKY